MLCSRGVGAPRSRLWCLASSMLQLPACFCLGRRFSLGQRPSRWRPHAAAGQPADEEARARASQALCLLRLYRDGRRGHAPGGFLRHCGGQVAAAAGAGQARRQRGARGGAGLLRLRRSGGAGAGRALLALHFARYAAQLLLNHAAGTTRGGGEEGGSVSTDEACLLWCLYPQLVADRGTPVRS